MRGGFIEECVVQSLLVRDLFYLVADTFLPLLRRFFNLIWRDSFFFYPAATFLLELIWRPLQSFKIESSKYVHVWWSKIADVVDKDLLKATAESSHIRELKEGGQCNTLPETILCNAIARKPHQALQAWLLIFSLFYFTRMTNLQCSRIRR